MMLLKGPRPVDIFESWIGKPAVCAGLVLEDNGMNYPSHRLLLYGYHYFLARTLAHLTELSSHPFYCIVCDHKWARFELYAIHDTFTTYAPKHAEFGGDFTAWFGLGCSQSGQKQCVIDETVTQLRSDASAKGLDVTE